MDEDRNLRAADGDRERAAELIRRHYGVGRVDSDELEERLQAIYHARTYAELDACFVDLPPLAEPSRAAVPPVAAGSGRAFSVAVTLGGSPAEVSYRTLAALRYAMADAGYRLVHTGERRLEFSRRRTPSWAWPVMVLTFPFGLLALSARYEERVTVELEPAGEGTTRVLAYGEGPRRARVAIERLGR